MLLLGVFSGVGGGGGVGGVRLGGLEDGIATIFPHIYCALSKSNGGGGGMVRMGVLAPMVTPLATGLNRIKMSVTCFNKGDKLLNMCIELRDILMFVDIVFVLIR